MVPVTSLWMNTINMQLKPGVKLRDLSPQMALANAVVKSVCDQFSVPCVITSANDATHSVKSLHYSGRALDYRTKYFQLNGHELAFRNAVKEALGDEFDVVLEAIGTPNEHLHVEWDPK